MSKVRLALIGCGNMAASHAQRFHVLADRVSVVAAVDTEKERADKIAGMLNGCRAATDYREVLDDVDAVLIAVPHHFHHPVGVACLEAGKHVLLEKPLANSEQRCIDLIEASKKSGRILMVAYVMRFHPLVVRMKELLDERVYGDVFQVSIWTEQLTEFPAGHWRASAKNLGGGQLMSHGCHYIDILLWWLGRPIRGTHLGTRRGTPWMEREGTSNVAIEFEGGVLGYHFGTWGARGTKLGYSFQAHCERGMIELDFRNGKLIGHQNVRGETLVPQQELFLDVGNRKFTERELAHFLDCLETDATPLTDGPGSLQGLRLIWRLYEAEDKGVMADLRGLGLDEYKG